MIIWINNYLSPLELTGILAQIMKSRDYLSETNFKCGTVLRDTFNECWTLGSEIGKGGFGLVYSGKF